MTQADAEALRKAMKGFGTDEAALIKICANRSNQQRQAIKAAYKAAFGRDLIEDLKSELHGKFEDAMIALFTEPIEYDCDELRGAMKGAGTNEDTLIEIIASRTPQVLRLVKEKYKQKYKRDLEEDVKKETSGTLRHLLISLLQCSRSVNTNPNPNQMAAIAQEIYKCCKVPLVSFLTSVSKSLLYFSWYLAFTALSTLGGLEAIISIKVSSFVPNPFIPSLS